MTLVVDASVVVAALVDSGPDGTWAERVLLSDHLAAPHLMPVEVANVLRRGDLNGTLDSLDAMIAHDDLLQMRVELFPYEMFAHRVWELRDGVTAYDAWYVSLAEALDCPLVTLDRRLIGAYGPVCRFLAPPEPARD